MTQAAVSEWSVSSRVTARLVGWQSLAVVVTQVAQSAVVLATAAIVDPSQFALWAVASLVLNLQSLVANLGLGPALIYRSRDAETSDDVSASVVLSLALSLVLFVGALVLAPQVAALFTEGFSASEVTSVVMVMSVALLATGPTQIAQALLERRLEFGLKSRRELVATGVGTLVSIALLVAGAGIWALVIGRVVWAWVLLIATWQAVDLTGIRIRPRLTRDSTVALIRFGLPISAAAMLTFLAMNADTVLMGRSYGAERMGLYALAFTIAGLAPTFLISSAGKVAFPLYVKASSNRGALDRAFSLIVGWIAAVMGVVTCSLVLVAPTAVPSVLGADWSGMTVFLYILAAYGLASVALAALLTLRASLGRPGDAFRAQIVWLAVTAAMLVLLYDEGSWGIPASFTVGLGAAVAFASWRARNAVSASSLVSLAPAILASCVAAAAVLLLRALDDEASWPAELAVLLVAYAGVVVATSWRLRDRFRLRHTAQPREVSAQ